MSPLRTRAEIVKLARTLGVEPERLTALEPAGPDALRALREQISDGLIEAHRTAFERVAALAERLPAPLAASLAQRVLGPALSARAAAVLRPHKAVELARRLPPAFLADIAIAIDARHVCDLLAELDAETAAAVAVELQRGEEWVAMGMLMGCLSEPALRTAVVGLDDRTILHTGFVVEDPKRLRAVVDELGGARVRGLVEQAAAEDLWPELVELAAQLEPAQLDRLAGAVSEEHRAALREAAEADPDARFVARALADEAPTGPA